METINTNTVDEMQKIEENLKKYNWVLILITVITIPFIVSNL
ncbi:MULTISPECIES: hypothetical protein [unclassified Bacillus (in: firmicutes)]|nr:MULTISPECIES: hypothetical protein [unclassified Bacillus (in: firmicutes)]